PRRTGVTVYSISAPSCKVINLKPKWVTDCIQNHGNASQCHHHILENFEDLQQDHSIQSASTSDFGVKGAPFLKCLERPEQDFPYLTDALLFHNYWAGGSRHLEFTTSNCMAKFLVREKNWKWSLFQTSSVDDRGAMVFAIENSGWFTILGNFFYGFVSIALIIHGLFALAAQEKRVLYVPRVQRFVNDTKYFKFLFPSMMVPITFPDDDTTVVQFKGSVIMGSDVWMNHWLYIAMSILDAVVNIRSTYVIFQTGTFLVGRKANLENFLFLASSLTKTTWLMCFVHTVVRWALKIIARALKNIRMVHPSVREKLDWYADASSMFLSYKIYSIMLFTLLCILLSYKKSTFQIRQVPGKRGVFGGDSALATFWGSELMCDMFVLLSLMALGGHFIGTLLLLTKYRHVTNNRVMKLLQKRYFFVGWDALIAMEALGIDPMASDAVVEEVAVAMFSRRVCVSVHLSPSGLVSLSGDYLSSTTVFRESPFPIKRAIIMGLCPTARNSSRSHLTSTRVYAPRVVAQSHRTSAVDESTKLDEIDEKNTIQSCLLENRKGSKSIFERQLILFSISTYGRLLLVDESEPGKVVKNADTNLTEYVVSDALSFASILDIKPLLANQKKLKIA
uniref:Uncharacterized protein n=1 Tax=Globisporangium ultimum (strain ATCC 200006 / CBS 805.95 / DAOM BR144) TaxID=431595 RepID=K3XCP9_GLOUD